MLDYNLKSLMLETILLNLISKKELNSKDLLLALKYNSNNYYDIETSMYYENINNLIKNKMILSKIKVDVFNNKIKKSYALTNKGKYKLKFNIEVWNTFVNNTDLLLK